MAKKNEARALVLDGVKNLQQQVFSLPEIKDEDALLRVEACGLCGTDHEQYTGHLPTRFAFIPGHEAVGVIEEIGSAAAERWGVQVGDRVAIEVFQSCRTCDFCRRGEYNRCESHGIQDMYGGVAISQAPSLWGGYAEYQYLAPDTMLHKVPENLDPVLATIFNPLGAGVRWGATVPGTKEGDVVAVLGPGIRGISALVAAKEAGAAFVMVTGYGPNDAPRLETAKNFGADLVVDVAVDNPGVALNGATGVLADVVVDVTAKAPAALGQAIGIARPGGVIVMAGTRGSGETPGFWPDMIVYKELHIVGALGVDAPAYKKALEILSSGAYPFADLRREVADLDTTSILLGKMAGEGSEAPPIHGVLTP